MPLTTISTPNTSVTSVPGTTLFTNTVITTGGLNYISVEDGSANALHGSLNTSGGTAISLAAGLGIRIKTSNSLQAGANTFMFNGTSKNIVKQSSGSGAHTIQTIIASGAVLDLVYDGTQWQLVGY